MLPDESDCVFRRTLTERERQVLGGIFEGLTNKEIAGQIGVSEGAVKATLQQLFLKRRGCGRSQLVRIALGESLGTGAEGVIGVKTPLPK